MKSNYTDYMFASARLRATDGKGSAKERLDRMLQVKSSEELTSVIEDLYALTPSSSPDEAIAKAVNAVFELLNESVPNPAAYNFLKYKYDCCNVKVAIKSHILGADYNNLYYSCGSVSPEIIAEMPTSGDFSALPENMAAASSKALENYRVHGEARAIDITIDSACYRDITKSVADFGVSEISDYYAMRADMTNILTALRILRLNSNPETMHSLINRSLVDGGRIPKELFSAEESLDLSSIEAYWGLTEFSACAKTLSPEKIDSFASLEKKFDEIAIGYVSSLKYRPFGAEVPAWIVITREFEMKNARLIASGLRSGMSQTEIGERLRSAYV